MGSKPSWTKITQKKYSFEGEFYPIDLYENIKKYLEDKQYEVDESEIEMKVMDGEIKIFTHLLAEWEFTRRYYLKLAFSINMGGKIIDNSTQKVNGSLVLHVNGFIQQHSLLHEKNPNVVSKFLTVCYDKLIDRDEKGRVIMNTVIEMGKLIAEVKNQVHRR
ncbi:MAG: hypothetical protein ACLFPL_03330 [Candidatus Nanoarchaeia archaeon]